MLLSVLLSERIDKKIQWKLLLLLASTLTCVDKNLKCWKGNWQMWFTSFFYYLWKCSKQILNNVKKMWYKGKMNFTKQIFKVLPVNW